MHGRRITVIAASAAADESGGLWRLELDPATGALARRDQVARLPQAGFLRLSPDGRTLYATAKCTNGGHALNAFRVGPHGGLEALSGQSVGTASFCHLSTARAGRILLAADYGKALAAVFSAGADGSPEPDVATVQHTGATAAVPDRQSVPHIHSITPDPGDQRVLVCDFSADCITIYRLTDDGQLSGPRESPVGRGDGPRHLVFHPDGKTVYVINELSGSVTVWIYDADSGGLTLLQRVSTLPPGFRDDNTAAEILISPDRRWLYASNRGHDSVAWFRIDPVDGRLTRQGIVPSGGDHPRNMMLDPTGRCLLVANRFSDGIAVFRIADATGEPVPAGPVLALPEPMGLVAHLK